MLPPTHSLPSFLIYTDGACSGNPGPGGWGAIVLLPSGHVTELGGRENPTTNNQMELMATIRALEFVKTIPGTVDVLTDSTYVIRGITQWIWGWKKRGWISAEGKEVANQNLWLALDRATQGRKINWKYVRGHAGIPGNERVDQIAVSFSQNLPSELYRGSLGNYPVRIQDIPSDTSIPEMKDRSKEKSKAYSYLSLVGSTPQRHLTWSECEARVKGQSGAKFKKAMSLEEETKILQSWGVRSLPGR